MSEDEYENTTRFLRGVAFSEGFEKIFSTHNVDVVSLAAAAGLPCGVVPLGYADAYNGRAYGMVIVAGADEEGAIIKFMSVWEATHPDLRRPPPQLVNWETERHIS